MKTKLLFTKKTKTFYFLMVLCLCFNYGFSQILTLNSTMDEHTSSTTDNADSWDMSPNDEILDEMGATIPSPYYALWVNDDLDDWLNTNCGDSDEQPGSSSDGQWDYSAGPTMGVKTRGVKIYEACRRLYQKVAVTAGVSYTLFLDSRSEWPAVPSEVYILNTEIADEVAIDSDGGVAAGIRDAYMDITNDHNTSKSNATTDNFTKNSLEFTPSGSSIVIYVRAPLAVSSTTEVFYDNIELYETSSLSVNDVFASKVSVYPNPAEDFLSIEAGNVELTSVSVFNILGSKVLEQNELVDNKLNISSLESGVYLLKIAGDNSAVATKKFIVK